VLDETSILPRKQTETSREIIKTWIAGLPAYELAALERGVLASKSLLVASRLVVEWGEGFRQLQYNNTPTKSSAEAKQEEAAAENTRFTIEAAAEACSTEVTWQTAMWGQVEDTHDVEREDLRRQLGSVVLLVCGDG
jgi:ATP synthase mitochondrial F1 complex assembly factor 2